MVNVTTNAWRDFNQNRVWSKPTNDFSSSLSVVMTKHYIMRSLYSKLMM